MSEELSSEKLDLLYEIIEVAKATGRIKKGTNEATKAIEKEVAKIVAYAKDANPPEVVMHIPLLAKEKGIPCFAVPKKEELGASAGLPVSTSAVAVVEEGNAAKLIKQLLKDVKPVEEKKEEPKAEEKPAEEAKEEPKAEEKPAEEAKEEPKAEEKPAEEAKEEPKAEENKEEAKE